MYPEVSDSFKKKSSFLSDSSKHTKRKVVGAIVFDGEKFLLLHRVLNWRGWEYPKGGIDAGEDAIGAIGRELFEETGLVKYEVIGKVDEYTFVDNVHNREVFMQSYLVRVSSNNKVHFDNQPLENGKKVFEHDDFKWCFPSEAVKLLTHNNSKRAMKKAIKMLGLKAELS